MIDDIKPNPASENVPERTGDGLAGAFEELVQGRLTGDRGLRRRDAESAQVGNDAGPCPDPGDLALLLDVEAGSAESLKVNALLAHAAACGRCSVHLQTLFADVSEEESAVLAGLRYSSSEGQRRLAEQLAGTPAQSSSGRFGPSSRRPMRTYLWAGAALAASLLIAVGLISWRRAAGNPENLVAEAYAQDRIFDMRVPGAEYSAVTPRTHLRGGPTEREPASLLAARKKIERELGAAPEDAHWLQLEARSDILEEQFDPAIDILDRLIAAGPVSPGLLLDDASAYFQRGEAAGSEADRTKALDLLRRADEMAPGDPVVLFNEALAMEDRGQWMNAVETWNRYLRFERDPRWLAEGRRRLGALEQKLNELKTRTIQP